MSPLAGLDGYDPRLPRHIVSPDRDGISVAGGASLQNPAAPPYTESPARRAT